VIGSEEHRCRDGIIFPQNQNKPEAFIDEGDGVQGNIDDAPHPD
jgi:hypothetical protein